MVIANELTRIAEIQYLELCQVAYNNFDLRCIRIQLVTQV